MSTAPSYEEQWRILRSRNRVGLLVLVVGFPAMIAVAIVTSTVLPWMRADAALFIAAVLWSVALLWAGFRIARFRCPKCEQLYFSHDGVRLYTHRRKCASCGLAIYGGVDA